MSYEARIGDDGEFTIPPEIWAEKEWAGTKYVSIEDLPDGSGISMRPATPEEIKTLPQEEPQT